jgi:hypothetical protein
MLIIEVIISLVNDSVCGVELVSININELELASLLGFNEISKIHFNTSLLVEVVLD